MAPGPPECIPEATQKGSWTVVQLLNAKGLPALDTMSPSDPYVQVTVLRNHRPQCTSRSFPYVLNSENPVWNSSRLLNAPLHVKEGARPTDELFLIIYDHDSDVRTACCGTDVIGWCRIKVADIEKSKGFMITKPIKLSRTASRRLQEKQTLASPQSVKAWESQRASVRTTASGFSRISREASEVSLDRNDLTDSQNQTDATFVKKVMEFQRSWKRSAGAVRKEINITLRFVPKSLFVKWPRIKWLFFIRHGESLWNVAEEKLLRFQPTFDLVVKSDHHLSLDGIKQANTLNNQVKLLNDIMFHASGIDGDLVGIRDQLFHEHSELYGMFLQADRIYSSPLSRALQTAMISLREHPMSKTRGIYLRSELREVKNTFGADSRSRSQGLVIANRARDYVVEAVKTQKTLNMSKREEPSPTSHVTSHDPETLSQSLTLESLALNTQLAEFEEDDLDDILAHARSVQIDIGNTAHEWWNEVKETSSELQTRIKELLCLMKMSPEDNIILVSHSLLIRSIIRDFLEPEFSKEYKMKKPNLATHKMPNCGVVALRANFDLDIEHCIDRVELLFGTGRTAATSSNKMNKESTQQPYDDNMSVCSSDSLPTLDMSDDDDEDATPASTAKRHTAFSSPMIKKRSSKGEAAPVGPVLARLSTPQTAGSASPKIGASSSERALKGRRKKTNSIGGMDRTRTLDL